MDEPEPYDFQRYLSAKKTVDDRALDRPVVDELGDELARRSDPEAPVRILEAGAGIGTMIERLIEWEILPERVTYTAIDVEPANVERGLDRLPEWAEDRALTCSRTDERSFSLKGEGRRIDLEWEVGDVFTYAREAEERTWDLVIAQSFLDLVNVPVRLPLLFELLEPNGLFYFPITFDGGTIFQPTIDPVFDAQIEECYHDTMDRRIIGGNPSGDSQAGRHLFEQVREAGGTVLGAGGSDWVVFAENGSYEADEAYFLHHILHMVENALTHNPEIDDDELDAWIAQRRHQIGQGRLVYIAHQLDLIGRFSG